LLASLKAFAQDWGVEPARAADRAKP